MVKIFPIFLILFFVFGSNVFAHSFGQTPFFKINGQYADFYTVPFEGSGEIEIAQDLAPENYLVNQKLEFEIDTRAAGMPDSVAEETQFYWDFGDKITGEGKITTHEYKVPGSYILKVYAKYKDYAGSQLYQTTFINIVENRNYFLPKAVISVNGKSIEDPVLNPLKIDLAKPVVFDSSGSEGEVVEFKWIFGDGKTSTDGSVEHLYENSKSTDRVFPVLRVVDKNGFISDTYVQLDNSSINNYLPISNLNNPKSLLKYLLIPIFILQGIFIFWKIKSKNTES